MNGIGTLLSRSLAAQGLAWVAGKPLTFQPTGYPSLPFHFRFFEATALAMLTIFIQHYKVEPHPKFAGESFEQLKERYSQSKSVVTVT